MVTKTYKTYSLKGLQMLLFDERGHAFEVEFRGGVQIDSTARFTTTDEKEQKAIESCSGFNRDFYLESVREDKPAEAPAPAIEKEPAAEVEEVAEEEPKNEETTDGNVVEVADKSEAVEWLKEHYPEKGYTGVKLRAKAAFDEACKECGVEFKYTA